MRFRGGGGKSGSLLFSMAMDSRRRRRRSGRLYHELENFVQVNKLGTLVGSNALKKEKKRVPCVLSILGFWFIQG